MSLHKAFNALTIEFIDKLMSTIPEEKLFNKLKLAMNLMIKINYLKPVGLFKIYIEKYRTYIYNRDDDYFLKEDYSHILEENKIGIKMEENAFNMIDRLKNYWGTFSENNKKVVWEYLTQLLKIADAIQ